MAYTILKVIISAVIIVAISEIGRRSSLLGGLLASLPLTSLLAFIWLYVDTRDVQQVAALSNSIFWLVLPSLTFFIVFPLLLKRTEFGWAMLASIGVMLAGYYAMLYVLGRLGINL
jgi:hypothetical protein